MIYDSIVIKKNIERDYEPDGEYFSKVISMGLAQMYNSPRAEYVSDRVMIILSDGQCYTGDAVSGARGQFSPS